MSTPSQSYRNPFSHQRRFYLALCKRLQKFNLWIREEYQIGVYSADIYVHPRWVFEIDGPEHRTTIMQKSDAKRTEFLASVGKCVTRYTNDQVDDDIEKIVEEAFRLIIPKQIPSKEVIRAHTHPR